jgi:hypothetical protein
MAVNGWKPLGELLVEQGLVSPEDLERALEEQARTGRKLGEYFVEAELVSLEQLTNVLLQQCGVDLTTDTGFGSGLRDKLAAGSEPRRDPVRFEFPTEEAAPEKSRRFSLRRKDTAVQEVEAPMPTAAPAPAPTPAQAPAPPPAQAPARKDPKALITQLEVLVKQFEDQQRGLVENLANLRRTLAGFDQ